MNFGFWTPSDLADILFDDQYGRDFLGLFSLLCSFSLVVLLQWLNTLDDVWVSGGPRTSSFVPLPNNVLSIIYVPPSTSTSLQSFP
jgi:hypothetical protein